MKLILFLIGLAILVLGALGHISAGVSKVEIGDGLKFTVPAWLGGAALFMVLAIIVP